MTSRDAQARGAAVAPTTIPQSPPFGYFILAFRGYLLFLLHICCGGPAGEFGWPPDCPIFMHMSARVDGLALPCAGFEALDPDTWSMLFKQSMSVAVCRPQNSAKFGRHVRSG